MSLPEAQLHSAINTSIKLLTLSASLPSTALKQPISNLQDLSNRLAMTNSKFKERKGESQAKKWLLAQNIDLSKIKEAAKSLKRTQKIQTEPEVEYWQGIKLESQINHKGSLNFQEYEETIAHVAVSKASSQRQASHMNDLLASMRESIFGKRDTVETSEQEAVANLPIVKTHQFLRIYAEKDLNLTDILYACDCYDDEIEEPFQQICSLLQCQAKAVEQAGKKGLMAVTLQQIKRTQKLKLTWESNDTYLFRTEDLIAKHGNNESQFGKQSKQIVQRCVNECINSPERLIQAIKVILGLGKYQHLFTLYDEISQNKSFFVFLFIALAYHYQLLIAFSEDSTGNISTKTIQILREFIGNIALFAASHKKENPFEFYSLLVYLLLILKRLNKMANHFEPFLQQLALTLQIKMVDLQQLDCAFVDRFVEQNSLGKKLIKEILWRMTPKTCQDHMLLASVSKDLEVPDAFVKFILEWEIKDQREREEKAEELFVGSLQLPEIDEKTMKEIKEGLVDKLSDGNQLLLFFVGKLKELKKLVKMRRGQHMLENRKEIQRFLENYKVLDELRVLYDNRNVNCFDLYVSYYEEIQKMYKVIYTKAASQLRQKHRELRSQLIDLQTRYPIMKSARLQRLMILLQ